MFRSCRHASLHQRCSNRFHPACSTRLFCPITFGPSSLSGAALQALCCAASPIAVKWLLSRKSLPSLTMRFNDHCARFGVRGPSACILCWFAMHTALVALSELQVLLMCQLRHPNIVSAEDIYMSEDVAASTHPDIQMRMRANDLFVCMPYYPADLAWIIHCSPQQLTPQHIQARERCQTQQTSVQLFSTLCH